MDLRGKYGQLQPPPSEITSSFAPLPSPKVKLVQRARSPSVNPQTRSRKPSAERSKEASTLPASPMLPSRKKFVVHPVTYDPTRPVQVHDTGSHQNPPSPTSNKSAAFVAPSHSPAASCFAKNPDSDQDTANNDNDDDEDDTGSEFEEERYMQMLQQYAELSGISFSTGFLTEFEDTVFGTNPTPSSQESSSSSNQTLEDEMDDLPFHKSRLPKDYKPNVVNPRPLMDVDSGPAIPHWPPFITGILPPPELVKAGLLQKEPFYVPPPVPTSSSAPLPSAEPFIPITVFESSYSPYQDPPRSTPPPPSSSTPPSPQLSVLHDSQASHPTGTPHFNIPQLYFESRFECGNLGKAIRRGPTQYELHCRNDVNTAGHTQWYFFQVKGLIMRNEATYEDIVYRFDIVNMSKPKTLYTQGLRPLMYSEKRADTDGIGWFRCGNDIQYHETPPDLFTNDEPQSDPQQPPLPPKYTLSFTFKAIHQSDTVYFAHCYPYSYTTLQTDLQSMKTDPLRAPLFRHSILAKSVAGNNIDLLTITKPVTCPEDLVSRKGVILSARVHPGETNASWMMRGLLLWLTGASCEAEEVRRRFVVKVVPMINPDGVIVGNYRCNLTGYDLNRQWMSTKKPSAGKAIPEVCAMVGLLERSVASREVVFFCDFHGHNRKNGIFMYGCESEGNDRATAGPSASARRMSFTTAPTPQQPTKKRACTPTTIRLPRSTTSASSQDTLTNPSTPPATTTSTNTPTTTEPDTTTLPPLPPPPPPPPPQPKPTPKYSERVLPYLLSLSTPTLFHFRRCHFHMPASKRGTARISVHRRFNIAHSYTLESSFLGSQGAHFSTRDLEKMGEGVGGALYDGFCVEGGWERVYGVVVRGVEGGEVGMVAESSESGETTSDDEVLRVVEKRRRAVGSGRGGGGVGGNGKGGLDKGVVVGKKEERPRYNNRPVPVTPPVLPIVSGGRIGSGFKGRGSVVGKEAITMSKVKVVEKTTTVSPFKSDTPSLKHIAKQQSKEGAALVQDLKSVAAQAIATSNTRHQTQNHNKLSTVSQPASRLSGSFKIKSLAPGVFYKPISNQHHNTVSAVQEGSTTTVTSKTMNVGWIDEKGNRIKDTSATQKVVHTLSLKEGGSQEKMSIGKVDSTTGGPKKSFNLKASRPVSTSARSSIVGATAQPQQLGFVPGDVIVMPRAPLLMEK